MTDKTYFTGEPMGESLPPLPHGSVWRQNRWGLAANEANLILLADERVLDCTDAADALRWKRIGDDTDITHWSRVRDPGPMFAPNHPIQTGVRPAEGE